MESGIALDEGHHQVLEDVEITQVARVIELVQITVAGIRRGDSWPGVR